MIGLALTLIGWSFLFALVLAPFMLLWALIQAIRGK